ncbi:MAG: nickel insertion protein [Nitrososphaerales archaeon]
MSNSQRPNSEVVQSARKGPIKFERDIVAIIETNVDDVTGEILSRTVERMMSEGAYDATATPYLGKKGRQGNTIRIVCSTDSIEKLAQVLVEETGTLGVKTTEYTRLIVPRRVISVPVSIENFHGNVSVKVAEWKGRVLRIKPELAEAKQIADSQKMPLREVIEKISTLAKQYLASQTDDFQPPPAKT